MENNKPSWDINKIESAQKTFFFQRHDGSVIYVQEEEAWSLLRGGNKVIGPVIPPPKLIGVSDGALFQKAMYEAQGLWKEGRIDEAKARLKQGEKEELEAARGKIVLPRNFDIIGRDGQPVNMRDLRR